jgi:hypothetical protein
MTTKDAWTELDAYLLRLLRRLGGDGYQLLDSKGVRLPFVLSVHLIDEFENAIQLLSSMCGSASMLPKVAARRFNADPRNCFVAEPVLSTHLLIVLFTDKFKRGGPPDPANVAQTLDTAHSTLARLVRRLPSDDDGGGGPFAVAQQCACRE